MDKGPHIIPLVPGGVPVIIHASQNEGTGEDYWKNINQKPAVYDVGFYLLEDNDTYHVFTTNDELSGVGGDHSYPAAFHYVRPDGYEDTIKMALDRDWYFIVDGAGNRTYSNPYNVYLQDFPNTITEVAGDVHCEILVYKGSDPKNGIARSANFILRVEPRPSMNANPHITYSDMPIDQSNNQNNENAGSYYSGDEDDPSLISWEDVVSEADTGDLTELLTPGQLIRPVRLKSGELMGLRCIHVANYKTAYFEPYHLFLAPKQFNNGGGNTPNYLYDASAAAFYIAQPNTFLYEKGQQWVDQLPYSVSSRIVMITENDKYVLGGTRIVNGVATEMQLDLYKTSAGRTKTTSDGVARQWYLNALTSEGYMCIEENGLEGRTRYQKGDDIYVNPIFYIVGKDHQDPSTVPVDIQSWADVKNAAAQGKLLNSTLQVGQLMPELPTVGVLRCVHITENWAAFDMTALTLTASDSNGADTMSSPLRSLELTQDEKNIFTPLLSGRIGSTSYTYYSQMESAINLGETTDVYPGHNNETISKITFDYYKNARSDNSIRIKRNTEGNAVGYWVGSSGSGSSMSIYSIGINGNFGSAIKGSTNHTGNVNGVFVVGEIS